MSVREARFTDIPAMAAILTEMYGASVFAERGYSLDLKTAKAILVQAIQRHGTRTDGSTCVYVAEHEGKITGLIVGVQQAAYQILAEQEATDLFFYNAPGGDKRDGVRLLDAFIAWAEACPSVTRIWMAATNAIGDYERTAKLYARKGLTQAGVIYERSLQCPAS